MSHSRRRLILRFTLGAAVLGTGLVSAFAILYWIDYGVRDPIARLGGRITVDSVPYEDLNRWIDRVNPRFSPSRDGFARDVVVEVGLSRTAADNSTLQLLRGMDHLQNLDLSETRIDDAGLAHLEGLPRLRLLLLTQTAVTDAGLTHLSTLPRLGSLFLGRTGITDAGLKQIGLFPSLMTLNLIDTDISDAGLAELKGLSHLKILTLGSNPGVTDEGVRQLAAALPELTVHVHDLDEKDRSVRRRDFESTEGGPPVGVVGFLGWYSATDADLLGLAAYPDLTALSLEGSRVTDAGLEHLHRLKHLQWLDVTGTQVTADAIASLKEALPELKVVTE